MAHDSEGTTQPPDAGATNRAPDRVTDLWRLLDEGPGGANQADQAPDEVDPATPATPATPAAPATSAKPPPTWAKDELGELLAQAWQTAGLTDGQPDPVAADQGWDGGGAWEVERLPTAAEGGVAAMFTARSSKPGPSFTATQKRLPPRTPPVAPGSVPEGLRGAATLDGLLASSPGADAVAPNLDTVFAALETLAAPTAPLGSRPPAWGLNAGALPPDADLGDDLTPGGGGRARLTEMLDHLPNEPTPRVRPEDVHIDAPVLAPVAVWFWGDDDIYPGRVATSAGSDVVTLRGRSGRGRRTTSPKSSKPARSKNGPGTARGKGDKTPAAE